MPFTIKQCDITKLSVDAIVNAANSSLLGGGGVDGAIHRAAGRGLLEECRGLGGCRTGEAKATGGYALPCRYVIHTVGPVWHGGSSGERRLLEACYRNSLELAVKLGCESVAFPVISSGVYGYPFREAVDVAVGTIRDFLEEHELSVVLVIFDRKRFRIDPAVERDLDRYIEEHGRISPALSGNAMPAKPRAKLSSAKYSKEAAPLYDMIPCAMALPSSVYEEDERASEKKDDLSDILSRMDESFSRNLLRRITASGMTDAECYKRANIDRKLFSKIRSDAGYRPSKPTVLAFAVALKLDMEGAEDLMRRAGFAFSDSFTFDVIVKYYIERGRYDIFEINEALFSHDQPLLGS